MTENKLLSFLNHASRDDLIGLPRIGPVLADNLIATRPFDKLEEAEKIRGISANLLPYFCAYRPHFYSAQKKERP